MAPAKKTVLVVDDEPHIVLGLRDALEFEGFRVIAAGDGRGGIALARSEGPDAIILDLMLPDMNGYAVCEELRRIDAQVPIVMLTARSQETDKVRGLDAGADDYVTKPFGVNELIARMRAILRRAARGVPSVPETLTIGEASVNLTSQIVSARGSDHMLSFYEVELLRMLAERAGQPVARDEILLKIWGLEASSTNRTVDNFIVKLRRKLEERADVMSQVRDPLLWAAFDLQSRVYNIVTGQFLSVYQQSGAAEHKAYAQRNTLFLFAQYFAWVEIIRRRVQFLDLGSAQENREIVNHLSGISGVLTSRKFPDLLFLVFRGDQRAIGEIMIEPQFSTELGCLGYAAFCKKLDTERSFAAWFKTLLRDIDELAADEAPRPRLTTLQHRLIDLINFLDPDSIRFPDWHRDKVLPAMPA